MTSINLAAFPVSSAPVFTMAMHMPQELPFQGNVIPGKLRKFSNLLFPLTY